MIKKIMAFTVLLMFFSVVSAEFPSFNQDSSWIKISAEYETGFLSVLHHTVQLGETGTVFDYRTMGGQEILFPFERFEVSAEILKQHNVIFLYQPLELNTTSVFRSDVTIDGVLFPTGSVVDMKYGFPFYRLTYGYDFFAEDELDLGLGAALQLRNASIVFTRVDGTQQTVNQNLGPVPAIYLFYKQDFKDFYLAAEATGLYASSAIINGASFAFEGSILDASVRAGVDFGGLELFANLRFLGGSAKGTSSYPDLFWTKGVEDYTANYLAFFIPSLGVQLK